MEFEIKTIFTLLFLADIFIVAFLFLYRILLKINVKKLNLYILGKLLQAIAIFFYSVVRESVPYEVAILAGNIPAIFGIALETYSFSTFSGLKIKKHLLLFLGLALIFSFVFGLNIYSVLHTRVFFVFLAYTSFFLLSGVILLLGKPISGIKLATSVILLFMTAMSIVRMVDSIYLGDNIHLFSQQFSEIMAFMVVFITSFILSINYIFLFKEEDEQTIHNNNRLLNDILNAFPDDVFLVDEHKNILFSNFNTKPNSTLQDKTCDIFSALFFKGWCEQCQLCKINSANPVIVKEYVNKETLQYYMANHILLYNGNILTIKKDITAEKKVQQRIKMLSEIVEQSPATIMVTNLKGNIEYVNRAFTKSTGYSFEEAMQQNANILHSELVSKNNYEALWKQITSGKVWHGEFVNKRKNGEIFYESAIVAPTFSEKGEIVNYFGIKQDITAEKLAKEALEESEQALNKYFNLNPIPVAVIDSDKVTFIRVNEAYANILGRPMNEIIGKTLSELQFLTEERLVKLKQLLFTTGKIENTRGIIKNMDGREIEVMTYAEFIELKGKRLVYTTSVDLTELNAAKKQLEIINLKLKDALDDKNVLLKEVHHRVKNNMQTISSLLFKQQRISNSEIIKLALQDSIDRISSIALVNEQIYRSENFKEIELSKYIHEISQHLMMAYKQPNKVITLEENTQQVLLSVDKAIPCSLIVNELISNSLKHGFNERQKGTIHINMKNLEEDFVLLTVEDDGVGLPKNFSLKSTNSLGMFIIFNLTKRQLLGEVDIKSENGTMIAIKFKK